MKRNAFLCAAALLLLLCLSVSAAEGRTQSNPALRRADLAVMLWQAEGSPLVDCALSAKDVDPRAPYANALRWACSEKLLNGYSAAELAPEDPLTREQLALILLRAAQRKLGSFDVGGRILHEYADGEQHSDFATAALTWATGCAILPPPVSGGGSLLRAQEAATAEEAQDAIEAMQLFLQK